MTTIDTRDICEAVKHYGLTTAKGYGKGEVSAAQERREKVAAKNLLRLILDREPTDEEITACLPW